MSQPKRVAAAIIGPSSCLCDVRVQKVQLVLAALLGRHEQDHQRDAHEHGQFPLPLRLYHLCGSTAGMHPMIWSIIPLCQVPS